MNGAAFSPPLFIARGPAGVRLRSLYQTSRRNHGAFNALSRPPLLASPGRTHEASVREVAAGEARAGTSAVSGGRPRRRLLSRGQRAPEGERRFARGGRAHSRHSRSRLLDRRARDHRRAAAVGIGFLDPGIRTQLHQPRRLRGIRARASRNQPAYLDALGAEAPRHQQHRRRRELPFDQGAGRARAAQSRGGVWAGCRRKTHLDPAENLAERRRRHGRGRARKRQPDAERVDTAKTVEPRVELLLSREQEKLGSRSRDLSDHALCWSMIFSENRFPPRIKSGAGFFGIMLYSAAFGGFFASASSCTLRMSGCGIAITL